MATWGAFASDAALEGRENMSTGEVKKANHLIDLGCFTSSPNKTPLDRVAQLSFFVVGMLGFMNFWKL